ncbi:MAG: tetratricopeptide repeat protein [Rhodocyclales bacterium]|nr:tetratricopeptide repeat protein [Rhodocyclales bacterium]
MDATSELLARAVSRFQAGEPELACATGFSILQAQPNHPDALLIAAAAWILQGHNDAARRLLDQVLLAVPGHSEADKMLQRIGAAPEGYAVSPVGSAQAYLDAGMKNWSEQHFHAALACWHHAIALDPARADLFNCRARAFAALGFTDAAQADFEHALALKPDFAEAHNNVGALLHQLGKRDAAAECYRRALTIRPAYALAHTNRGNALLELGRPDEAMTHFEAVIAAYPGHADGHLSAGTLSLLLGDFERGWREYEWRWASTGRGVPPRNYVQPLWLGDADVRRKRILLWSEQGFGDAIQFSRYASKLAALGAVVILEAPATLAPLLETLDGVAAFVAYGGALPPFDFHCPLLSLPLAFKTTLGELSGKPYLAPPPERIADWVKYVGSANQARVGLAWSGSTTHGNDRNRSIPLSRFSQVLASGIEYIQLQKDVRADDQAWLAQHPEIRSFAAQVKDFGDTAALIESLDLVITVDTSVAHLAGALGKDVWILLPQAPDWRWLLDRSDSPWYDSATLFRQPAPGDWDSALVAVRQALAERFGTLPSRASRHR